VLPVREVGGSQLLQGSLPDIRRQGHGGEGILVQWDEAVRRNRAARPRDMNPRKER
jgi:hypothetical protein